MHTLDATPVAYTLLFSRIDAMGDQRRMAYILVGSMIGPRTSNCISEIWLNGSLR